MKTIVTIALLALSLCGCAEIQKVEAVLHTVSTAKVDPQIVIVAGNVFDGLEATGTNWLRFCRLNAATGGSACSFAVKSQIIKAVRAGRVARNNGEQFLKDHPGALGDQGAYDALKVAIGTLQGVFRQYNIGATP